MRKITRIKITNYGAESWFKNTTLNLTDPATNDATDTIINLENGGGKTTLLAFIFSCFEPRQERFLQHIQKKQHQFTDYFAKDGTPGVILIEWQTPGQNDRLVIGQVVSVLAERPSPDRAFFAFSSTDTLNMDTVPLNLRSFAEWSNWLQTTQGQGDFYQTRGQSDWQRHLDARMIDVDVFRLQLEFSAEEGGIDAFLNFRNESEFVKRFFKQTLDRTRAGGVRDIVVQTCDALGRKPKLQQQQRELSTLASEVTDFATAADAYENDVAEQRSTVAHASGVVRALVDRSALKHVEATTLNEQAVHYAEIEQLGSSSLTVLETDKNVLEGLALRRQAEDAKGVQEADEEQLEEARREARILDGAHHLNDLNGLRHRLKGLHTTAASSQAGLAPVREEAAVAGEHLRLALVATINGEKEAVSRLQDEENLASSIKQDQQKRLVDLDWERQQAERRHSALLAQIKVGDDQHERLVSEAVLSPTETPDAAYDRWALLAEEHRAVHDGHVVQAQAHEDDALAARQETEEARRTAEAARNQSIQLRREQAEAERQHERLAQNDVLKQALDSDTINPDAPGLNDALDRLITSDEASIAQFNVRRAQLESDRQAVHETGVAGRQADVDSVVAFLHKQGVPAAQAFNLYISKTVADAVQAQALVTSDPARFLGVGVPPDDVSKARDALAKAGASLNLRAPVVVSAFAMSVAATDTARVVAVPSSTAAFNREAALVHVQSVDRDLASLDAQLGLARKRRDLGLAVKEQLRAYLERFGRGVRQGLADQLAEQAALIQDAIERESVVKDRVMVAQTAAKTSLRASQEATVQAQKADIQARAVADYIALHSSKRHERTVERDHIANTLDELGAQREDVLDALAKADHRRDTARNARYMREADLSLRRNEVNALVFQAPKGALKPLDAPASLDELRRRFADAVRLLNTQEQDRMGVLKVQIDQAEKEVATAQSAFDTRFGDLPLAWLSDRIDADLKENLVQAKALAEVVLARFNEASTRHTLASHDQQSFEKLHRKLPTPTADQEALSPDELVAAREALVAELADWQVRLEEARANVGAVRERARDAQDEVRRLDGYASTLRAVVDVDPSAATIVLNDDVDDAVQKLLASYKGLDKSTAQSRKKADKAFRSLITMISRPAFEEVEPQLADNLRSSSQDFEAACSYAHTWSAQVVERLATVQHQLESMKANFDGCVEELLALTRDGERVLNSAVNNKRVPASAPMVGGKAVMKMKVDFQRTPLDGKRAALAQYLDELILSRQVPEVGTDLVAESLFRIHGQALGIQLLKMVPHEDRQYMPVGEIKSSGGEGVTMALFLYMVINQLRAEMQAQMKKAGGGPLILDNPFAKMTNGTMWAAVRALADAMDIQLICATAISAEYNAFGEFRRFVRLRRTGINPVTQKTHLEVADLVLKVPPKEA